MLYTLIGFGLASVFGMAAHLALGFRGLVEAAWVDPLFWGIILAGFALDHHAQFRAWFGRQPLLVQNAVAAVGFVALATGLTFLLRDQPWTWHIAG